MTTAVLTWQGEELAVVTLVDGHALLTSGTAKVATWSRSSTASVRLGRSMSGSEVTILLFAVIGSGVGLASSWPRRQEDLPNSPFKLPFFVLCVLVGAVLLVSGTAVILMSIGCAIGLVEVGMIVAGRNPWWMQSPLDRRWAKRHSPGSKSQRSLP